MALTWKEKLKGKIPAEWEKALDDYESQLHLKKQGKVEDRIFAETRLRRGAYGQRYDNGLRHDGFEQKKIFFPTQATKGPNTEWDAPGMQRIKIPGGVVTPEQLEAIADLAEEYSDGIAHITTRQDFQLHFVHIEDTPDIMRRLAAVGITTQEACGNSVRNVTACPIAGVCATQVFDVTPYARACYRFLLGHPDAQDFGRKFKPAFSGCADKPCALVRMHDIGFLAKIENGKKGFQVFVGGGLGPVPYQAQELSAFVPVEEFLPLTQAVCRVFARHGEKKNRGRARIKFLVSDWGIEKFREEVYRERKKLSSDPRWTSLVEEELQKTEKPARAPKPLSSPPFEKAFQTWRAENVQPQAQEGYFTVEVRVPLGDLTAAQLRGLADISRLFSDGFLRTTVQQNILLRWVTEGDLPELFRALGRLGVAKAGADRIADITACPGTDTCKLGIASSRGMARVLSRHLEEKWGKLPAQVQRLRIKASGCPNSCGQHHIADIGFYGVSRKASGKAVPHFQLILGGRIHENASAYGLAIGVVPSKKVPEAVDRLLERYTKERGEEENFQAWVQRVGKVSIKEMLADLTFIPPYEIDPSYYSDWGDPREYTIKDIGKGECAGEVVSPAEFSLTDAEKEAFQAQLCLDRGDFNAAQEGAWRAMTSAAKSCLQVLDREYHEDDADRVCDAFRTRLLETGEFERVSPAAQYARYYTALAKGRFAASSADQARRAVEEAQLFIEAAHGFHNAGLALGLGAPVVGGGK